MTEFKLPELGENVDQGDLVRLMVSPGANISEGQPVMELETDKAVVEVPSSVSGTVKDVLVKQGEKLKVGQVLFTVENGAGGKRTDAKASGVVSGKQKEEGKTPAPQPAPAPSAGRKPDSPTPPSAASSAASSGVRTVPPETSTASEFRLPELGENIHQGDLVRLMISPGAQVQEGQPVIEIETDKAVVEVPSSVSGTIKDVLVGEGEKIKVGQVLFTLDPGSVSQPPPRAASDRPEPHDHARAAFQAALESEGKSEEEALPPDPPRTPPVTTFTMPLDLDRAAGVEHRDPVPAAPHVRRLARELGVDVHNVPGTGPGGRISEADVKALAKSMVLAAASGTGRPSLTHVQQPSLPDFSRWGKIERVSMRGVRRKTAEHMWEAWSAIPHVTQQDKADITELEQLRRRFAPKAVEAGGKMTVTAIALKVCASALKIFPQFNASIDMEKEEIVYKQFIHIGVAVDTDRGLLVPVIRDVDKKNIVELAGDLTQLSKKARDKKLSPTEMEGGTFTITNLGGIGGTGFSPIVNYPEVAILGLSHSSIEPVWLNGKFEPRTVLPLSLSYDHRLIDGADAARFLRWIAEAFEQPFLLSVQG